MEGENITYLWVLGGESFEILLKHLPGSGPSCREPTDHEVRLTDLQCLVLFSGLDGLRMNEGMEELIHTTMFLVPCVLNCRPTNKELRNARVSMDIV